MKCAFVSVSAILWLPWFGNRSAAAWGKEASQTEPGLSSQPWCTPHHRPGLLRPSSGFWWRTTHRYPSSQPTSPKGSQQSWVNSVCFPATGSHFSPWKNASYVHYLAKTALSQNHDEVEIWELDPILIAIVVILAHWRRGRRIGGLSWAHPCPLDRGATNKTNTWASHLKKKKRQHKPNLTCCHFVRLTSNFCRSSSLPSSPSGWTGTLKYSPSSWDRSLNLKPRIKTEQCQRKSRITTRLWQQVL